MNVYAAIARLLQEETAVAWKDMNQAQRRAYLKLHPRSKLRAGAPVDMSGHVRATIKELGDGSSNHIDRLLHGGCVDFRDALERRLQQHGIRDYEPTDTREHLRDLTLANPDALTPEEHSAYGWRHYHAFIKHRGKLYDAGNPEGVSDFRDMRYFKPLYGKRGLTDPRKKGKP